jgi:hypothetical protein
VLGAIVMDSSARLMLFWTVNKGMTYSPLASALFTISARDHENDCDQLLNRDLINNDEATTIVKERQ